MARARPQGFTLVEAAVAVGVVAILAGLMAPLAARVLEQRRAAATRRALRQAFEALFGRRGERIANLRADCRFEPKGDYGSLPFLVARSGELARVPDYRAAPFPYGWNGPYWQGDTRDGAPVDAWGNPIELLCGRRGVQVRSRGARREEAATADDLVYPPEPVPLAAFDAHVILTVSKDPAATGGVNVFYGGFQQLDLGPLAKGATQSFTFSLPAGGVLVTLHPNDTVKTPPAESKRSIPAPGDGKGQTLYPDTGPGLALHPDDGARFKRTLIPMDLLPGETRDLRVNL